MKVDTNRLKKGTSDVPSECQILIDKLKQCGRNELRNELKNIETWTFGKCELYHWIEVLDLFDLILDEAAEIDDDSEWVLAIDNKFSNDEKQLVVLVLNFTTLLIEHSFSRHLYNSVEHLITLLQSNDLDVVLVVLNLLYMFSKRSNFISRVNAIKKHTLLSRVGYLAESWGGKEQGFGLADCCQDKQFIDSPYHTQYFEITSDNNKTERISLSELKNINSDPRIVAEYVCQRLGRSISSDQKIHVYTRIRAALYFTDRNLRLKFVQARLQALSILVYSNFALINPETHLYPGFMEELVDLLQIENLKLVEIQAAALRTLTSIIHLDRNPHFPKKPGSRLFTIIDVTGASSYHGFLPGLVRTCILHLINPPESQGIQLFPMTLATSLFSFLYHLASYEAGGEALVASGMMDSLLKVINWPGTELEHITFVTRAVRVIDLITNIDMVSFQNYGGLFSFIKRLEMEIDICRAEQPNEITTTFSNLNTSDQEMAVDNETHSNIVDSESESNTATGCSNSSADKSINTQVSQDELLKKLKDQIKDLHSFSAIQDTSVMSKNWQQANTTKMCLPQRAALLKSMLNFLKKAIQDATFAESIRHVMEGGLPKSLQHIISNAEYYGPSLFLLATDVVTVYVFQEPSLLSYLQDIGLTDVILQALLKKDVPATREVLGSLPNVFSALCLNSKGLEAFVKYNPFYKLFRVLLSPKYLSAMRRRRSSDPMGDTASNLGNAMDELMRHQPSLRLKATKAVIRLLQELVYFGTDPQFICWRAQNKNTDSPSSPKSNANSSSNISSPNPNSGNTDAGSSDDDDDDDDEEEEEEASTSSTAHQSQQQQPAQQSGANTTNTDGTGGTNERIPIPLIDYILNIMKFVDAILSNNSTNDHCIEFINEGGLTPLLSILALPNLPIDSPITASAQSVAAVYKSIMNLSHDPRVLRYALEDLADVVEKLKPLTGHLESPGGSVLLRELANCPSIEGAFSSATYTPLLHAMSAVHGYVVMLVHVCRSGQLEVRHMSLHSWGGNTRYGIKLLKNLVQLYTALVWESTLLLALCTDDIIPPGCDFAREDMEKLVPDDFRGVSEITWDKIILNNRRVGVAKIVETLENGSMEFETSAQTTTPSASSQLKTSTTGTSSSSSSASQNDDQSSTKRQIISPTPAQLRYIKALLGASSRLGRALAELFGLLVKLCVGAPFRQRRQNFQPTPHTNAKEIARVLSHILVDGLSFEKLPPSPIPKLKLTFLICSVGFTSPMLFDDKRYAYHLMLEKFVDEGGLVAFFRMFKWALTRGGQIKFEGAIENVDLPDGTGEFLDSWLVLLDKLSNPRAILDSPHIMSSSGQKNRQNIIPPTVSEFDCISYLKNIHSLAYSAIQYIWGYKPLKIYGVRMTESVLSILRHIIRGEGIIKLRLEERNKEVSAENVKQLMDMGFPKKQCEDALERAGGVVETATEILLCAQAGEEGAAATANSVAEGGSTSTTLPKSSVEPTNSSGGGSNSGAKGSKKCKDEFEDMHLTSEMLDQFTEDAIFATIRLLDELPESVYRVCDLVIAIIQRNGSIARDNILTIYVGEIHEYVIKLLKAIKDINKFDEICSGELAKKAAVRIHLFTLLFEGHCSDEMRVPCASALHRHGIIPILLNLLTEIEKMMTKYAKLNSSKIPKKTQSNGSQQHQQTQTQHQLSSNTNDSSSSSSSTATNEVNITPKWLAPLFLLIDFYQKIAEITQNRYGMHRATSRVWKWYDLSTGRWNPYSDTANKAINEAYWGGQPIVRVTGGRQRYSISFNCMIQVNEETGTHRPVILSLKSYEKYEKPDRTIKRPNPTNNSSPSSSSSSSSSSSPSSVASATSGTSYRQKSSQPPIGSGGSVAASSTAPTTTGGIMFAVDKTRRRITDFEESTQKIECENVRILPEIICKIPILKRNAIRDIVLSSVGLMKLPIDRDTLHAVMRVCLRFTRDYEMAKLFGSEGGVKILLSLNQDSSYLGFITLATLLIRHTFEEPTTLKVSMEQVILSRTLPSLPSGYKELIYLARQMGAAVLRQPDVWVDAARELLRIDVNLLRSPSLVLPDDNRLFVKSALNFNLTVKRDCWLLSHVIQDLMISLVDYDFKIIDQNTLARNNQDGESSKNSSIFDKFNLSIDLSSSGNLNQDGSNNNEQIEDDVETTTNDDNVFVENQNNCVLSKSAILKILAAAIRSYYSVAVEIVEFIYTPENCPIFTENMTSLSYILDYLLPIMHTEKDRDCSSSAKLVIASIASSADCRVLNIVATEVRNALNRALSMPESKIKHTRIQLLCEVIQTMIESCPAENPSNPIDIEFQAAFPVRSTLFFIMHRRHILTDLARASQSIDLTSPGALNTINAILEPLEALIRLSNQPSLLTTNTNSSNNSAARMRAVPSTLDNQEMALEVSLDVSPQQSSSGTSMPTLQLQESREEQSTSSSGGSTVSAPVSAPAPSTSSATRSRAQFLLDLNYLERSLGNENVNIDDQNLNSSNPSGETLINQTGRCETEPSQAPVIIAETSSESGGDSDSNQTDNDERDMEEVENDEENDEDEEEEERSEMDVDEETRQYIEFYGQHDLSPTNGQQNVNPDPHLFRSRMSPNLLERGQDDILMIQFTPDPNAGGGGSAIVQSNRLPNPGTSNSLNNIPSEHGPIGRYVFPVSDELMSGVGVAPSSGNVVDRMPPTALNNANQTTQNQGTIASHPLLMGRSSSSHGGGSSSLQSNSIHTEPTPSSNARNQLRPSSTRQRRYQYFNFNSRNLSQTPVILQRLLGPPSTQTENNTRAAVAAQAFRDATRVVLMDNNGLGFFSSRNDEESIDVVDHAGYLFGRSLAATLNQTPTALHWWTEEAKILGSESQSDVCLLACDQLIPDLIKVRQMDAAELNSKKKKRTNDDTNSGGKEKQTAIGSVNTTGSSSRMDTTDSMLVPMVVLPESSVRSIMSAQRSNNSRDNLPASDNSNNSNQNLHESSEYLLPRSDIYRIFNLPSGITPSQTLIGSGESGPSNQTSNTDSSNRIHSNISSSAEEEEPLNQEIDLSIDDGEMHEGELQVSFESVSDEIDDILNLHQSNEGGGGSSNNPVIDEDEDTQPFIPPPRTPPLPAEEDPPNNLNTGGRSNDEWTQTTSLFFQQLRADAEQMQQEQQDDDDDAEEDNDDEDEDEEEDDEEDDGDGDDDDEDDEDGAIGGDGDQIRHSSNRSTRQTSQSIQVIDDSLRSILGDIEIPDGVDPSFLAALPDEMRAEVLNEHMRMQRNRQRTEQQEQNTAAAAVQSESAIVEVNPEFLAALPPNIQEEVLAQQRIELQRQAAATTNPEDPVDAAAFFQNLNPTLRQAILTDMEESQISVLPPELAAEAQTLRQNWEVRNRQLMQDRLLTQITSSSTSSSIPSVLRYRRQNAPRTRWSNWNSTTGSNEAVQNLSIQPTHLERLSPLLDHESIASILVLIFKIDTRFYHLRLQRIIRQLCVHIPTRDWIIKSLISILDKCNSSCTKFNSGSGQRPTWLGIKVDPSICSTANVFSLVEKYPKDKKITDRVPISIHPQSVTPISCEVLDHLIAIAKIYPTSFLATLKIRNKSTQQQPPPPPNNDEPVPSTSNKPTSNSSSSSSASSSPLSQQANSAPINESDDFWDIILQLDYNSYERILSGSNAFGPFSNTQRRPKQINQAAEYTNFHETPFGKLIPMLNQCRNNYISDKLLRLLSLISVGFLNKRELDKDKNSQAKNRLCIVDPGLLPGTDDLRIIVSMLTNTANSEEGLEDATNLILNTSKCTNKLRIDIYDLLIESVKNLAKQVEGRIEDLMRDVIALNRERQTELNNTPSTSTSTSPATSTSTHYSSGLLSKGSLRDRFTHETVVISSSGTATKKTVCDIHLPTMGPLTSKSSCQAIFLGLLNVINQIRENPTKVSSDAETKDAGDKSKSNDNTNEETKEHYSMKAPLSEVLKLNVLWTTLSECLDHLEQTADHHAVLVLQPAVEAFFLVHATKKDNPSTNQPGPSSSSTNVNRTDTSLTSPNEPGATIAASSRNRLSIYTLDDDDPPPLSPIVNQDDTSVGSDQKKFLLFAEKHRTVLNQILRQSQTHLSDGPFACLTDHARILDFDVKRRYFRTELERLDEGVRREELAVHVRRVTVFEDSFKELYRRQPEEWKNRFYIVFEEEEGQDAGGLLREWYVIISREIFNPMYALFTVSPGDRVTYMINSSSHANPNHLCYYKFVGRVIAKAIYDNKLLECYFTRSFYKHILGIKVKYTDMESEDYEFYQGLVYLMENHVSTLGYEVTFSLEINEFGVTTVRDIIPNGRNITVTEENKLEYIQRVCQLKMSGSIRHQLNAFLEGFYDIIPKRLISIFNEQELELLISGLPNIDIEDLRINTEYHKYQPNSMQIQWFWRALRSFDQAERAKFLQFVTGTSKVPLQGFAALEGMNGTQKFQIHRDDRSTERLPSAHTCFNQLDLPVYKTFDKLRCSLLKAIHECSEGFGFA